MANAEMLYMYIAYCYCSFAVPFLISKRTGLIVVKQRLRSTVLLADKTFSEPIRFKIIATPIGPPPNFYSSVNCDFNLKERIHSVLSNTVLGKTVESEENQEGERLPKHVYYYVASQHVINPGYLVTAAKTLQDLCYSTCLGVDAGKNVTVLKTQR